MNMGFCGGTLLFPEFTTKVDGEFTTLMQATVVGIYKEDIEIEYQNDVELDEVKHKFVLAICGTSNNNRINNQSTSFNIKLPVDTKEYYGYDYFLENGVFTLILYKTQKSSDIGLFTDKPFIKYKREPFVFV